MLRGTGFAVAVLVALAVRAWAEDSPPRVRDIEVRLFYHHSGTLSEDITAKREYPFLLWNTLIGAGDAKEPSTALLADVLVEGPAGSFEPDRVLEFEAVEANGKPFYASSSRLGVFSQNGLHHTGFWLADVSCKNLRLKARIAGGEVVETVTFNCGE
jgi:hypothetical protein